MWLSSMALCVLVSASVASEVTLPIGNTPLGDIGIYQVAYQSYDQDPVSMPPGWHGHFDQTSGISYMPHEQVMGRSAILMHSPWHVPPGKVWVDYAIHLPETVPLALSFGIAMRDDVALPDKSDGVTFSCAVIDETGAHELMRHHQTASQWLDYRFDLGLWAGKTIKLRLQVEPGPANNASWDYSNFGNPTLVCGDSNAARNVQLTDITNARSYQAVADASLKDFSTPREDSVAPGNLLPCTNRIELAGEGYAFIYEGADARVVYRYAPRTGTLDDFEVCVDDTEVFFPAYGGGVVFVNEGNANTSIARGGQAIETTLAADGKSLRVVWAYPAGDKQIPVTWTFGMFGKALLVEAVCDQPVVSRFSLGYEGAVPLRRIVDIPYLMGNAAYLQSQRVYIARYFDWTYSQASRAANSDAEYDVLTDGTRNTLRDRGYIAVSPDLREVLPNPPQPASPYIALLGPKIMLDIWKHHDGTFAGDGENLRVLKDNGVDHVAIIQHVWQRFGYDVKLPDHIPANPDFGGEDGMIAFGKAANDCGYVWSLHENYIDIYPDAPSYDPTARVLNSDGSPALAWFNAGTGVQSFGLKCTRAKGFAEQNAPEIHRRYGTNAAYLDVHTCVPPWHELDHEAGQPMAGMALAKMKYDTDLFQYMRDTHQGPLFGEGNNQFFWAGRCDGVEAQVGGSENHQPLLDFDLTRLHSRMVNHGMGYYERWFMRGYQHQWGFDTGSPMQVDKYRAQEIAYGHAGFIGSQQTDNIQWVAKEHHIMHAIQRLAGNARVTDIAYEAEGQLVNISAAWALNAWDRQRIRYDSGLTVWVNWRPEPWTVEGRVLPQWGFLALGPDTEVFLEEQDGRLFDYAACPEYRFIDARTSFEMPYLNPEKEIAPRVAKWEYLGGNAIQLTYEWAVNEALDQDGNCFVHFVDRAKPDEGIVTQNDHPLPKPLSQWKPGELITDGPYTITLPEKGCVVCGHRAVQ